MTTSSIPAGFSDQPKVYLNAIIIFSIILCNKLIVLQSPCCKLIIAEMSQVT
jgi:hypothetical protein